MFAGLMIAILVGGLLFQPRVSLRRRKSFCIYASILLVIVAALRGNYTIDMGRYAINFSRIANTSWPQVLLEEYHRGLYVFVKILSYLSSDTQFIYGVLASVFSVAVGMLIYQNSTDPTLSYFILIPMGYFAFTLTGIAQGIAMALIIFAYLAIAKNKWILSIFLILLASTFHTSAIVGLILVILYRTKVHRYTALIFGLVYALIYLNRYSLGAWLIEFVGYREYAVEISEGGIAELAIYLLIIAATVVFCNRDLELSRRDRFPFLVCVCGALLFTFVPVLTEFFRVALYFNVFTIILLPFVIERIQQQNDYKVGIVLRLVLYIVLFVEYYGFTQGSSGMNLYKFFWQ